MLEKGCEWSKGSANPSKIIRARTCWATSAAVVQLRKTSRENCIIKVMHEKLWGKLDIQHHNSHVKVVSLCDYMPRACTFRSSAMMHLDGSSITKNINDSCFSMAQKIFANNAIFSYASDRKLCNSIYGTCWNSHLYRLLARRKIDNSQAALTQIIFLSESAKRHLESRHFLLCRPMLIIKKA